MQIRKKNYFLLCRRCLYFNIFLSDKGPPTDVSITPVAGQCAFLVTWAAPRGIKPDRYKIWYEKVGPRENIATQTSTEATHFTIRSADLKARDYIRVYVQAVCGKVVDGDLSDPISYIVPCSQGKLSCLKIHFCSFNSTFGFLYCNGGVMKVINIYPTLALI